MFEWDETPTQRGPSTRVKLIALGLVLIIVLGTGSILLSSLTFDDGSNAIKVAVVDSGISPGGNIHIRVVDSKSFVLKKYGYSSDETDTSDSRPDDVPHGTLVASTIVNEYSNVVFLNAKVLGKKGTATTAGIVAAIKWAVDQGTDVINLSIGGSPTVGDPMREAVDYAFSKGVVVVAAAGNEGDHQIAGTTINTPAIMTNALCVGAVDSYGNPAYYTSYGPTADRFIKPDLVAKGETRDVNYIYYGTSFASPRVAAAAAKLIAYCKTNEIKYNVGTIMTLLLASATPLNSPEYLTGAGLLNVQGALNMLQSHANDNSEIKMSYLLPTALPNDFEHLFFGDNYTFNIHIFTTGQATFQTSFEGVGTGLFKLPDSVEINQTGLVTLKVAIPNWSNSTFRLIDSKIHFSSDEFGNLTMNFYEITKKPIARVAFDISHTTWSIDTIYGQFRQFYSWITGGNISVTEIRRETPITRALLDQFDAVVILDPCVWDINETNMEDPEVFSLPYSKSEIQAYHDYFNDGGGIFVTALSNKTLDVASLNNFLAWTNFSIAYTQIDYGGNPVEVDTLFTHPITTGVKAFDYYGAPINVPADGTTLAEYGSLDVLGCLEGSSGGRLVVTGTNYFIDNWGLNGKYNTVNDWELASRIVYWIIGAL